MQTLAPIKCFDSTIKDGAWKFTFLTLTWHWIFSVLFWKVGPCFKNYFGRWWVNRKAIWKHLHSKFSTVVFSRESYLGTSEHAQLILTVYCLLCLCPRLGHHRCWAKLQIGVQVYHHTLFSSNSSEKPELFPVIVSPVKWCSRPCPNATCWLRADGFLYCPRVVVNNF